MVAFREKVLDQFGEVNVLMLNAAVFVGGGTFADNLPVWRKMIDVNLCVFLSSLLSLVLQRILFSLG